MAEVFNVESTEEGVKVEAGAKFTPEGQDYDPGEYVQGKLSDQKHVDLAVDRLENRMNELNKKLNEATYSVTEFDSTDKKEAQVLRDVVKKKLDGLGENFMKELGKVEMSGGAMGEISYDIDKSELIGSLLREPLGNFIDNELGTLIAAAEDSDGDSEEFKMAALSPEERKKADIERRAARASGALAGTFGKGNVYTSNADAADKIRNQH